MISAAVMLAGALIWLAGELYGQFSHKPGEHPTTWYVRMAETKYWWLRLVVIILTTGLGLHFVAHFL